MCLCSFVRRLGFFNFRWCLQLRIGWIIYLNMFLVWSELDHHENMEVTCQSDSHHQDLRHALFVDGSSWMFANKIPAYFYLLVYPNRE